jgi:hydrogenase-4 component F
LKPNRFKRLLAYHSVEHMGIIIFGIGIGSPLAIFAALLHAFNHALIKSLMFLVHGSIQYEYTGQLPGQVGEGDVDRHIKGVLTSMPVSGTILGLGGLALVGSPPFSIFMSEFLILYAAFQEMIRMNSGQSWLLGLSIGLFLLTVTLIFGGLVGHLARLLLGRAPFRVIEPVLGRWIWPFIILMMIITIGGLIVPDIPLHLPYLLEQSTAVILHLDEVRIGLAP